MDGTVGWRIDQVLHFKGLPRFQIFANMLNLIQMDNYLEKYKIAGISVLF